MTIFNVSHPSVHSARLFGAYLGVIVGVEGSGELLKPQLSSCKNNEQEIVINERYSEEG